MGIRIQVCWVQNPVSRIHCSRWQTYRHRELHVTVAVHAQPSLFVVFGVTQVALPRLEIAEHVQEELAIRLVLIGPALRAVGTLQRRGAMLPLPVNHEPLTIAMRLWTLWAFAEVVCGYFV